jgi:hypothetical protein
LEDNFPNAQFFLVQIDDDYFSNIIEFLSTGFEPREFTIVQKKNLVVRDADYQLIASHLYKLGEDKILRRCVMEHENPIILVETHEGIVGGHYIGNSTMHKVLCTKGIACRIMVTNSSQGFKGVLSKLRCLSKSGKSI